MTLLGILALLFVGFIAGYEVRRVLFAPDRPPPRSLRRGIVTVPTAHGRLAYQISVKGYECAQCDSTGATVPDVLHEPWCIGSSFYRTPPRPNR